MLRRVNTRFFFIIATWGKLTPENAKIVVIKKFFKKFFVEYLSLKNTQKNKKYCVEIMDDILSKPLMLCGFRGVDKVIFGCYNEATPRENGAHN